MSASRGDSLELTDADFNRALALLKQTEVKMHKTFGGLGTAPHADISEKIIAYIQTLGITTRSQLLTKFYHDLDAQTLISVEQLLEQMKVVEIRLLPDKREKVYTWIKH